MASTTTLARANWSGAAGSNFAMIALIRPSATRENAAMGAVLLVALGHNGTLYVADTVNSRITAIPFAGFLQRSFGTGIPSRLAEL